MHGNAATDLLHDARDRNRVRYRDSNNDTKMAKTGEQRIPARDPKQCAVGILQGKAERIIKHSVQSR